MSFLIKTTKKVANSVSGTHPDNWQESVQTTRQTSRYETKDPSRNERFPQPQGPKEVNHQGRPSLRTDQSQTSRYDTQNQYQPDPNDVIRDLNGDLDACRCEIQRLRGKNAALEQDNEKLGEDLRVLQERSFRGLEDARWMPLDTNTINGDLTVIRDAIWDIAKSYAADSIESIKGVSEDAQLAFRSSLEHVVRFEQEGPGAILEITDIKHAPRLLLTALISHSVHRDIFANSFFCLDDGLRENFEALSGTAERDMMKQRRNASEVLAGIYQEACSYDINKANIWRSDTLRLINPTNLNSDMAKMRLRESRKAVDDSARYFAQILSQNLNSSLLQPMEAAVRGEFFAKLTTVFINAGRLSICLWSQRPALGCRYLSSLARTPFYNSSNILQAHRLYKLDDPDDRSLDERLTKIVVQPAILALGSHEADHYDREEVLAKAVVWLDAERAASGGPEARK